MDKIWILRGVGEKGQFPHEIVFNNEEKAFERKRELESDWANENFIYEVRGPYHLK